MGAERHGSGDPDDAPPDDDGDAMWRPDTASVTMTSSESRARRDRGGDAVAEPSPWSRESIEAPLPTIAEVRERWRRELGSDRPTTGPTEAGPRRAVSVPQQPPSSTTGGIVLIAMLVAVAVGVSLSIAWAVRPTSDPLNVEAVPATATVRWQAAVSVLSPWNLAANGEVAVVFSDGELRAIDAVTGESLWRRQMSADDYELAIYDDGLVVASYRPGGFTLEGFDLETGRRRYDRTTGSGGVMLLDDGIVEFVHSATTSTVRVVDPAVGVAVGPAALTSELTPTEGYVIGRTSGRLALLDVATGAIERPLIADLGLASIAPVGDRIVGFTDEASIVLYDDEGVVVDQRPFVSDVRGDFRGRAQLVGGVPDTSIGMVASGSSIGFDVSDGRIDVIWELLGRVGPAVDTELGPISVARTVDAETAEIDEELIDVLTGESIAVTDAGITRVAPPIVLHDGYVTHPALGDSDRVVAGYGFDGIERWSVATPMGSWFEVHGGVLYVVDPSEGVLVAYG